MQDKNSAGEHGSLLSTILLQWEETCPWLVHVSLCQEQICVTVHVNASETIGMDSVVPGQNSIPSKRGVQGMNKRS